MTVLQYRLMKTIEALLQAMVEFNFKETVSMLYPNYYEQPHSLVGVNMQGAFCMTGCNNYSENKRSIQL